MIYIYSRFLRRSATALNVNASNVSGRNDQLNAILTDQRQLHLSSPQRLSLQASNNVPDTNFTAHFRNSTLAAILGGHGQQHNRLIDIDEYDQNSIGDNSYGDEDTDEGPARTIWEPVVNDMLQTIQNSRDILNCNNSLSTNSQYRENNTFI